jgi:hypothetical protein
LVTEAGIIYDDGNEINSHSRAFYTEDEARAYMLERAKELYYNYTGDEYKEDELKQDEEPDELDETNDSGDEECPNYFTVHKDVIYFGDGSNDDGSLDERSQGLIKVEKVVICPY